MLFSLVSSSLTLARADDSVLACVAILVSRLVSFFRFLLRVSFTFLIASSLRASCNNEMESPLPPSGEVWGVSGVEMGTCEMGVCCVCSDCWRTMSVRSRCSFSFWICRRRTLKIASFCLWLHGPLSYAWIIASWSCISMVAPFTGFLVLSHNVGLMPYLPGGGNFEVLTFNLLSRIIRPADGLPASARMGETEVSVLPAALTRTPISGTAAFAESLIASCCSSRRRCCCSQPSNNSLAAFPATLCVFGGLPTCKFFLSVT